jgi:hypothetical protein
MGPYLRTPNPGFNPGFTPPPHLLYKRGVNPGLNPGFDVLRFGLWNYGKERNTWPLIAWKSRKKR